VWVEPHRVDQADAVREDLVTTIHLYNARVRRVGYSQLLTTYKRHIDTAFEELVRCSTFDEYIAIAESRFDDGVYLTAL
jgi:hypothetical protein